MNRRQFAQTLAAAAILAPFASLARAGRNGAARRVALAPRRLVVVTSLGTIKSLWSPQQRPGGPLVLPKILLPLAPVADQLVLVDGLSFVNPTEGHSTPQTLTGFTYANGYGPSCTSVDQVVAKAVGVGQRLPSLLLGWQANSEAHFWAGGRRLATLDDPVLGWQTAFGGLAPADTGQAADPAVTARRQRTWYLVQRQAERLAATLGGDERARLDVHVRSIAALSSRGAQSASTPSCVVPSQPKSGNNPQADASQATVASAQADLIVAALACDVTRVVGMQFGTSNRQYIGGEVNDDEHSAVHSGSEYLPRVIGAEQAVAGWVARLVQALAATPDPAAPEGSLLDNTLVVWARDIADGPAHTQYSMPYALLGGGTYLGKSAGGRYLNFGGDDATSTVGRPHQRLLLNLLTYAGLTASSDFGTVAALAPADRAPLGELLG